MKIKWYWKGGACRAIITLFLSIVMMLAFIPATSFAEGEGEDAAGDFNWDEHNHEMECLSDWNILYSDGSLDFVIRDVGIPAGMSTDDLKVSIGRYDKAADQMIWDIWEMGTPGLYSFREGENENDLIITMDGEAAKAAGAMPYEWVEVSIVCDNDSDGDDLEIFWSAHCGFEYREASVEYWLPEDRDILPGWEGTVDGRVRVRIEDSEHPGDGDEWDIAAEEIKLVSGENLFSDSHIDSDENEPERIWYYYRAKEPKEKQYGTAVFSVEYTDLENNKQSGEVKVNVASDVYRVNVRSSDGRYKGLPGDQFELHANAAHEYCSENGEGEYDYKNDTVGLTYEWEITRGEDFADITTDPGDPSKATVSLKLPEGYNTDNGFWEDIDVACRIYDGSEEVKADDWRRFNLADSFTEIFPALIGDLEVGSSASVTPEVRMYPGTEGREYDTIGDVSFEWYYDSNAVSITDKDGNAVGNRDEQDHYIGSADPQKFTVKRLREWDTNINLEADWDNGHEHFEYHLDGIECRIDDIWHDRDVYTDEPEAPSVEFEADLGENWQERLDVDLTVGTWDGRTDTWNEVYENTTDKQYYTTELTDDKVTVTLTESFFKGITDYTDIRVFGEVYMKGAERNEDNRLSDTDSWLHIKPARTEYHRFEDCDLLTSRDELNIDRYFRVRVENSEYPGGEEFDCEVTNVEIIEEIPETAGKKVVRNFRKDYRDNNQTSDEYWWHMEAATPGTARIKVTYNDPEVLGGETGKTYEFTATVSDDVYEVWISSADGRNKGQDGTTIDLIADAVHRTRQGDTTEGITYDWEVINGEEFADVTPDKNDPSKATVTLRLPEGYNKDRGYWEDIDVECKIYDGSVADVAKDSIRLNIADSYADISPELIKDLEVGASVTVTPEARSYPGSDGADYDVIEDATFEWYYDGNAVAIKDKDGNIVGNRDENDSYIGSDKPQEFTITRLKEWDTDINLQALWNEDGENREEWRQYRFNWKNLDLHSKEHDVWISTDTAGKAIPEAVFDVSLGDGWQERLDVVITAGLWDNAADDWAGECFDTGENGDFIIRKTNDEIGISISEKLLKSFADTGGKDIRVTAEVYPKGLADSDLIGDKRLTDADLWIHVFDPEANYIRMKFFDLVKGDKVTIPEYDQAWVRDTAHPHGGFEQFRFTGVSIDGSSSAVTIKETNNDGKAWEIEAVDTGEARIKLEYKTLNGEDKSDYLIVRVEDEVRYAELHVEDNVRDVTPGSTAKLIAKVYKHTSGEEDVEITDSSDLSFKWSLIEGSEFADIIGNKNEATVKFKASDRDWFDEGVRAELIIKSGDKEIWYDEYEFRYVNESDGIYGVAIDPDIHIGESVTVTPEARHYPSKTEASAGYDVASDARFEWDYDKNVVSIEEKNGSYVIRRTGRAGTTITLKAFWEDSEGYERYAEQWYDLFKDEGCEHEYGEPSYEWADDNSTVTAKRICIYDNTHIDSETVNTTAEVTEPTCEAAGKTVYTATFSNKAFVAQTKEVAGEPALGHRWGDWKRTKEPTVDAEGSEERVCSVCGSRETKAIEKLPPKEQQDGGQDTEAEKAAAAKETLNNTVADAKKTEKGNYTDESFKALQDAIAEAEALANDSKATAEQLKAAADKVAAAKAALREKEAEPTVSAGDAVNVNNNVYKVTSVDKKTVTFTKAKNAKSVTVPASIKINGEVYKVTEIGAKAFKGKKIRSVTIGKNVKKIKTKAFDGSKVTTVTVKTKLLKKAGVKGSLKGSKVKTLVIKVGSKTVNKKFVKSYKKIFTKANAGKNVTVK